MTDLERATAIAHDFADHYPDDSDRCLLAREFLKLTESMEPRIVGAAGDYRVVRDIIGASKNIDDDGDEVHRLALFDSRTAAEAALTKWKEAQK